MGTISFTDRNKVILKGPADKSKIDNLYQKSTTDNMCKINPEIGSWLFLNSSFILFFKFSFDIVYELNVIIEGYKNLVCHFVRKLNILISL